MATKLSNIYALLEDESAPQQRKQPQPQQPKQQPQQQQKPAEQRPKSAPAAKPAAPAQSKKDLDRTGGVTAQQKQQQPKQQGQQKKTDDQGEFTQVGGAAKTQRKPQQGGQQKEGQQRRQNNAPRAPRTPTGEGQSPVAAEGEVKQGGRQGERRPRTTEGGRPPKREFERHSGTGRGREVSKNGAGAHNWGKEGDEYQPRRPRNYNRKPQQAEVEPESPVGENAEAPAEAAETKPVELTEAQKKQKEEEEAEAKKKTLDEYLRERKAMAPKIKKPKARTAPETAEPVQGQALKRDEEEVFIKLSAKQESTEKKQAQPQEQKKKVDVSDFLGLLLDLCYFVRCRLSFVRHLLKADAPLV